MTRLQAQVRRVDDIAGGCEAAMYALYAAHYDACEPERFHIDLRAKDYVILIEEAGQLRGFSTVAHSRFAATGGEVQVLFSGDTIIDRAAWGEQALSRSFARLAGSLHAREQATPLYWLLISKGHRTYRYLSVFARRFFPHPDTRDAALEALAGELAGARFGDDYDARTGVIAFARSHGHLKGELAEVPAHRRQRPDIAFFLERNPGYVQGHELVCLTELAPDNLRAGVREAFVAGMRDELA
jgi:hypothetical protein